MFQHPTAMSERIDPKYLFCCNPSIKIPIRVFITTDIQIFQAQPPKYFFTFQLNSNVISRWITTETSEEWGGWCEWVRQRPIYFQSIQLLLLMEDSSACGFFGCGGREMGVEERAQEQLSSHCSRQLALKTAKSAEARPPASPRTKEIFSFRLNCFRNTPDSDKDHLHNHKFTHKLPETAHKLTPFRSCEKTLLTTPQPLPFPRQTQRFFCSPPSKLQLPQLREARSPETRASTMVVSAPGQLKVSFSSPSEAYLSQVGKSKQSEHTHYSSQKSVADPIWGAIRGAQFTNQKQMDSADKWTIHTEKSNTQKSCIFDRQEEYGGETQRTLIDCLNEEPAFTKNESRGSEQGTNYFPTVESQSVRVAGVRMGQASMLRHHAVTVRALVPCRMNA